MKIAVVQMQSSKNLLVNLNKMKRWVEEAANKEADIVVFPEMAYLTGGFKDWKPIVPKYEELAQEFKDWAKMYGIRIIPGTLREPKKGDEDRFFNTLLYISAKGEVLGKYRKIFLYQAVLPHKVYDEAQYCEAGKTTTVYEDKLGNLAFAICFDLRFPEMFRHFKKSEAEIIFLPSAFTVPTGTAHWETLVRARAIENQVFFIAPGLTGTGGDGLETYGHSLVVDPWGNILTDMGTGEGLSIVDIDTKLIKETAKKVNAWESRREELFPIR